VYMLYSENKKKSDAEYNEVLGRWKGNTF